MAEPQAFDPSKPFTLVDAPPPAVDAATQREIDLGLRLPKPVVEKLNTPLFHPTGINLIDGLTSPANIGLTAVLGARSAAKAMAVAGEAISAGVDSAVVSKVLKFLTPTKFREGLDVLTEMAKAAAKGEAATPASPAPVVEPVASGPVAPAPPVAAQSPQVAPAAPASAPPPSAASAPSPITPPPATMGPDGLLTGRPGGNPSMPDQKSLNEAALAVRRAAYQARMSTASPASSAIPEAAGYAKPAPLSGAETKAFLDLMQRGVSGPEAMKTILAQRGLGAMTDAERIAAQDARYMRGEVKTPSAETARARKGKP